MRTACGLLLALLASDFGSTAAQASEPRFSFDIPASSATVSLGAFASATGIAIGWPSGLPQIRLRAVKGKMTVEAALAKLLADSGYRAERVGSLAYRIVPIQVRRLTLAPPAAPAPKRVAMPIPNVVSLLDIIVTGQKQPQLLQDVPMSVAAIDLTHRQMGSVAPGTRDIFDFIDGVSITNLGPGRNRQFIRGVADSPFNGPSQSTVAVQLDEARVTFDAPDPDIRLVDMERVEVLKGPQGPLYGSGALGGIYHLITRKPESSTLGGTIRIGGEAVQHGGLGGGIEGTVNLPLVEDQLAIRAVGYLSREGGWIDNEGRNHDANATNVTGARLALRWQPAPDWTVDLAGMLQDVNTLDSQYVTASNDTVHRTAAIAEPTDNDFKTAAITVKGRLGSLDLVGTSSYVRHKVSSVLDSTPASSAFGLDGASRYADARSFEIFNHELRISSPSRIRWLVGVSFLDAHSHDMGVISDDTTSLAIEGVDRKIQELAVFGEATVPLIDRVKVTAGARLFHTRTEDDAIEAAGGNIDRVSKTILSPSIALSWSPLERGLIYLRYARAMRPGGLALAENSQTRRFDSDELGTVDLGVRYSDPASRISVHGSLFETEWKYIQSDYLLSNGLTSTRNVGRARIYGAEASVDWRPWPALSLALGATYIDADLVRDATGEKLDDRRMPVTPDLALRALAQYRFDLGAWVATTGVQVNYIGNSRLSFDPSLDHKMGDYATVALNAIFSRPYMAISLKVDNLLDVKGDSFAFGNPFSIANGEQYTPLRPRTFSISISRDW
jgi:outer membrane receptor protein involved in Fe transport